MICQVVLLMILWDEMEQRQQRHLQKGSSIVLRDVVAGSYSTVQYVLGMLVSFLMAGLGTY